MDEYRLCKDCIFLTPTCDMPPCQECLLTDSKPYFLKFRPPSLPPCNVGLDDHYVDVSSICEAKVVGKGTKIWHFTHVMPGASIGKGVTIGQCCFIGNDVVIGDRCKIQNSVNIFQPARIGDDVFIGPGVTFCNVMRPRAIIEQKGNFLTTVIARGATIGANATILPGIHIGMFAFVAAGAVVTKDVPSHALVAGNPARLLYWVDFLGYQTCPADVKEEC